MWFGWGMWMGPIFLVLICLVIYYFVTSTSRTERHSSHEHPRYYSGKALEILKERYAKGEITKEQFLQMKNELR